MRFTPSLLNALAVFAALVLDAAAAQLDIVNIAGAKLRANPLGDPAARPAVAVGALRRSEE